jgi:CheY-like chemotaxis protein
MRRVCYHEGVMPRPIRALLIEDRPGDRQLIQEMLLPEGRARVELVCESRLAAGLERLAQQPFDVILLDLNLSLDSLGLETFLRVHAHAPAVPVILLTGVADEHVARAAVRRGAAAYLRKGEVDSDTLWATIRRATGASPPGAEPLRPDPSPAADASRARPP